MGKKRWKKGLLGMVVSLMFMASASMSWALYSADIAYDYADLGGGNYQVDFTVSNTSDPGDANLDFFMIFLDSGDWELFTNVVTTSHGMQMLISMIQALVVYRPMSGQTIPFLVPGDSGLLKAFPIRGSPSASVLVVHRALMPWGSATILNLGQMIRMVFRYGIVMAQQLNTIFWVMLTVLFIMSRVDRHRYLNRLRCFSSAQAL
jgi:hypothetical protein